MNSRSIRSYFSSEIMPNETNGAYFERVAESIPADVLMREVVYHFKEKGRRRGIPAKDYISDIFGYGTVFSAAIVKRFSEEGQGNG